MMVGDLTSMFKCKYVTMQEIQPMQQICKFILMVVGTTHQYLSAKNIETHGKFDSCSEYAVNLP